MSKEIKTDILIIGSGSAGYTAAIYSARANLKPLIFEGDRLVVNVRAPEKAHKDVINPVTPFGSLDVELLTENGEVLSGYSKADSDSYTGDNIQHTVTWKTNSNIGQLIGKPVRVRFYLRNTALYSFHFRGEQEPQET